MNTTWKYEDGLYQPTTSVYVASLNGSSDMWFEVEEQLLDNPRPSSKQQIAWDEFCNLPQTTMRQAFAKGLLNLAQRMDILPDDAKPEFGPTIYPKVMSTEARKVASALSKTDKAIGELTASTFLCNSIVVPLQDKAPVRFVLMNFEIGRSERTYGYELEALFCNNKLVFIAENSGLWTRLDWEYAFNTPDFNPDTAVHPYW